MTLESNQAIVPGEETAAILAYLAYLRLDRGGEKWTPGRIIKVSSSVFKPVQLPTSIHLTTITQCFLDPSFVYLMHDLFFASPQTELTTGQIQAADIRVHTLTKPRGLQCRI